MQKTIFAFATPEGRSALAVLRISGRQSRAIGEALAGSLPPPRVAQLRKLRDRRTDELLDEAIMLWFPGPASFTGEDCLELHVHGSRAVRRAFVDALEIFDNCAPAEAGEFTRRAFENGKTDLARLEGLADLLEAQTRAQRRQALKQMGGELSIWSERWRIYLLETMALLEATIDFSDEGDAPTEVLEEVARNICELQTALRDELEKSRFCEIVREGFRVVIAGAPNAGKSSLFNAMSRRDLAIVTEFAGTTRDVLEAPLEIDGRLVRVFDTAGLRETLNPVELIGVERAQKAAQAADLVLWLHAADQEPSRPSSQLAGFQEIIEVHTKADLLTKMPQSDHDIFVSAKTGEGVGRLLRVIGEKAAAELGGGESSVLSNARQREVIRVCIEHLDRAASVLATHSPEFVCEELRAAANSLSQLVGKIGVEDVLGAIFSRFCIGK